MELIQFTGKKTINDLKILDIFFWKASNFICIN